MCRIQSRRHCHVDINCNLSKHATHNKWKITNKHILKSMNQQVTHSKTSLSKSVPRCRYTKYAITYYIYSYCKKKSRTARNRQIGSIHFFPKSST